MPTTDTSATNEQKAETTNTPQETIINIKPNTTTASADSPTATPTATPTSLRDPTATHTFNERYLHISILQIIKVYKSQKPTLSEARKQNIRYIKSLITHVTCQLLLHNQVKKYIQEKMYTARTWFIVRRGSSEFRDLIQQTLDTFKTLSKQHAQANTIKELEQKLASIDEIHRNQLEEQDQEHSRNTDTLHLTIVQLKVQIKQLTNTSSSYQMRNMRSMITKLQQQLAARHVPAKKQNEASKAQHHCQLRAKQPQQQCHLNFQNI